jgi:hypothetical protein
MVDVVSNMLFEPKSSWMGGWVFSSKKPAKLTCSLKWCAPQSVHLLRSRSTASRLDQLSLRGEQEGRAMVEAGQSRDP